LGARGEIKGEITLLIGKTDETEKKTAPSRAGLRDRLEQVMANEQLDQKAALKKIAKEAGISKSEAYRELQRSK